MTDRTQSASTPAHAQQRRILSGENVATTVVVCIVMALGILIGGYLYGRYLSARDLGGRDQVIEGLRAENQKLKRAVDEKSAQLTAMQARFTGAQAALEAIKPTANTYNISSNQTLIVGDGLTIGMVGAPGNDSVTFNINGKQQVLSAGQVISVAPDPSTTCRVGVQSFDMFKAVLVAACAGAKAQ